MPDRAAGLEQHQAADVVPLGPQELTLVEHGLTGDLADPAHDDLPALAFSVAVDDGQYSRELHGTSLSMAQRFIGGDEVIGRLRGGDRCFVLPRGLGIPVATEPRGHASRTAQCQQVSAHTRTGA